MMRHKGVIFGVVCGLWALAPAYAIQIHTNFPGAGQELKVEQHRVDHFSIKFPRGGRHQVGWFMFRVTGASGKKVRIDLDGVPLAKWRTLNPLICETTSLARVELYETQPVEMVKWLRTPNETQVPETTSQRWKYITEVRPEPNHNRLTLIYQFETHSAYVAMRVPYTTDYHMAYMKQIQRLYKDRAQVIEVGRSVGRQPLYVIRVGSAPTGSVQAKPCVMIYGREHPDEHDSSWVAVGALEFLLSDSSEAVSARAAADYLIIPMLDPDGADSAQYEHICKSFGPNELSSLEARHYGAWLWHEINQGGRIDYVISVHNVESAESTQHLWCAYSTERGPGRGAASAAFLTAMVKQVQAQGLEASAGLGSASYMSDRWMGFVRTRYGATGYLVEANSQGRERHLLLSELKGIGRSMVQSVGGFVASDSGKKLAEKTERNMRLRMALVHRYESVVSLVAGPDPGAWESTLMKMPLLERGAMRASVKPLWFRKLPTSGSAPYPVDLNWDELETGDAEPINP